MERTNSILAVLGQAKVRLNALKNRVPCGIRSIDDETDRKISYLSEYVEKLERAICLI